MCPYNSRMEDVCVAEMGDMDLMNELIWWDKNLRRIPEWQIEGCTPPPNSPKLDYQRDYLKCASVIYWELKEEAKKRGIL
jgi:hypothetical protein